MRLPPRSWKGADAVRARMQREAPRRRADNSDAHDLLGGLFVGTCGADIDQPCRMSNPLECATHGPLALAEEETTDPASEPAKALRREIAQMRRKAMRGLSADYQRRVQALEATLGPGSASQLRAEIHAERMRGLSPSLRAVVLSFPLQRW